MECWAEELFREHRDPSRRYAKSLGILEDDFEDLFQETLLRMIGGNLQPENPAAYLRACIKHGAEKLRGDRERFVPLETATCLRIGPSSGNILPLISKPDRVVLYLRFVWGFDTHEIADALQLSNDAARKRVERARKRARTACS